MIKLHKGNNTTYNQEALCGGLFCMKVDFFPSHKIRLHDIVNISLHNIDNSLHFIGKKSYWNSGGNLVPTVPKKASKKI